MIAKKRKHNYLYIFVMFMFTVFLVLYLAGINGYYNYTEYNKMVMTKEAMIKFEKDIENGKNIDVDKYIKSLNKDYSNNISKLGIKTSKLCEKLFLKGLKKTIKFIKVLFVN